MGIAKSLCIQHQINPRRFREELETVALINSLPSCVIRLLKRYRVEEMSASIITTCETDMLSF